MRYEARVTAYDCLDRVAVGATLYRSTDGLPQPQERVLGISVLARGTGETEPADWLRDALVALLEAL